MILLIAIAYALLENLALKLFEQLQKASLKKKGHPTPRERDYA